MKINELVKRLSIASLCLGVAISAFGGIALPDNNVALAAELETIETTDFVYTGAEVTQELNGLRISSDNAYQATFKGVFTGDTTFKFILNKRKFLTIFSRFNPHKTIVFSITAFY